MINSSADQPIGYPIYVSPLTTSFIESHTQVNKVVGPSITFCTIGNAIRKGFRRLRQHFGTSGSSNLPIVTQSGGIGGVISSSNAPGGTGIGPTIAQAGNTPAPYRKRTGGSMGNASAIGLSGSIGHERFDDTISIKTAASTAPSGQNISPNDLVKPPTKPKRRFEMMEEESDETLESKDKTLQETNHDSTSRKGSVAPEDMYVEIIDEEKVCF